MLPSWVLKLCSNGSNQEDLSQHDLKTVEWDVMNQIKQNKSKELKSFSDKKEMV